MTNTVCALLTAMMVVTLYATGCGGNPTASPAGEAAWQEEFGLSECNLVSTGRNEYFILEPEFQLVLEGTTLVGRHEKLAITVLEETREVDGVETRVVEEREWRDGELIEVSRNSPSLSM